MNAITEARSATQPVNTRTGGSTFKNPPGQKAWKLVDDAGCRGLRIGDAQVSEMHCNFLINHGAPRAADIEALGEEVRRRVRETLGRRRSIGRSNAWVWRSPDSNQLEPAVRASGNGSLT